MKIPSGSTDRKLAFVAVDVTDLKTRETGLSGFTVYRSRDGGAATAYTTPTVAELSAANMPGVYVLTLDEDTTLAAGHDSEEYVVHITHASMAPVTRAIDIERVKFTEGQSAVMGNSTIDADVERWLGTAVPAPTTAGVPAVETIDISAAGQADIRSAVGLGAANLDTQLDALPTAAENADAVWDEDATAHQTQGTFGQAIGDPGADANTIYQSVVTDAAGANIAADIIAVKAETASIQADTNDIQTRLPAALVGGRMDSSVGAAAANTITASALAADAVSEIADQVWEEAIVDHSGTAGSTAEQLAAAGAAGDPWATALPGAYGAGTAGKIVGDNVNATISSRATQASVDTVDTNVDAILADTGTDGVVVAAASKTGYALSSAGITAIWDEVMEGAVSAVQMMRGFASALMGKASGLATTSAVYRDIGDTKDRITATVDADGNRTAVTRDLT